MSTLICFYNERKEEQPPHRLSRLPSKADVIDLDNLHALDRIVEEKTYRLIVLITFGFSIPSLWQTSRKNITCPIIVVTGMDWLDGEALSEIIERIDAAEFGNADSPRRELFQASLAYIEENLFDHELSLDKVASHIYVSRCHYSRMFQRQLGKGFKEYVIEKRMKKANELLRQGYTVTEVCFNVGYSDLTHFARVFKRKYGINPSSCRLNSEFYQNEGVLA